MADEIKKEFIIASPKDIDGLLDQMEKALAKFGVTINYPEQFEGSSDIGLLISNRELSQLEMDEYFELGPEDFVNEKDSKI